MVKKYISDIITDEEISKWKPGERILITAQTGLGKSHFVKNNIYEFCKENNLKCLFLSNRILLRQQNEKDLDERAEIIKPINYQTLEKQILNGQDIIDVFAGFDFIIYDECHYLFSDSDFSRNTDLLIEPIKNPMKDKIFLFITATPIALRAYQKEYEHIYTLPRDYSYIENVYFYSKESTPEIIIRNIPKGEKIIFFSSDAAQAYDLSLKFEDASFICSKGNRLYKKSDTKTSEQIRTKESFSSRMLATTKFLDNGVNLKDPDLKHIIIDMLDPVTLIQCLGRKRIMSDEEKINIYIKNYHGGYIFYNLAKIEKKLQTASIFEILGAESFQKEYRKKEFDAVIDNNFVPNLAMYQNYLTQQKYLKTMLEDTEKIGYKRYICNILDFNISKIKIAEEEFQMRRLRELMIANLGKKIFRENQESFKGEFFSQVFPNTIKVNYRKRGMQSMNAILDEEKLPFHISTFKETKGENKDKHYWVVLALPEGETD
jgi:hypothetical protein